MRIGISLSSSVTADSPAQAATRMVERAATAYSAGLTSLTVGDHHAEAGWYHQNTPTLGRLLAEWPDRPAGCLFLLPLWHPVLVAEQVGTLAAHVDAPFIVQIGVGAGEQQFASMGAEMSTRGRVTDEAIRVIQALLAGDEVESELLRIGPTTLGLRPTQAVEWWIAGLAPATLRRAARVGTAWYGAPGLTNGQSAELIEGYRRDCSEAGTTPRSIARRDVLVLADGDRARAEAAAIIERGYRGLDSARLLIGDSSDVEDQISQLEAVGYDDVIIRCMTLDQAHAVETIEQLGLVQGHFSS